MDTALRQFRAALRQAGHSNTSTRRAVFLALYDRPPMTMSELTRQARGVNRASVYRTVALFESLGIIQRIYTGWKYKVELADPYHAHHHHMHCTVCGRTEVIHTPELEALITTLAQNHGYTLTAHHIELQGVCKSCARMP